MGLYDLVKILESSGFLDIAIPNDEFPVCLCDNQSALALAESSITTKRSKHLQLRFHYVRERKDAL